MYEWRVKQIQNCSHRLLSCFYSSQILISTFNCIHEENFFFITLQPLKLCTDVLCDYSSNIFLSCNSKKIWDKSKKRRLELLFSPSLIAFISMYVPGCSPIMRKSSTKLFTPLDQTLAYWPKTNYWDWVIWEGKSKIYKKSSVTSTN